MKRHLTILKDIIIPATYWVVTFVTWMFFLRYFSQYHFFYLEQAQIFTGEIDTSESGWLALFLTGCYVQHFGMTGVGPILLSFINTLIAGATAFTLRRLGLKESGMVLAQLLPVSLTILFFDHLYYLTGTTAFLLAVAALAGTMVVKPWTARLVVASVAAPLLHWLIGPAAILYAASVFLADLFMVPGCRKLAFLAPLATASAVACYAVFSGVIGSMVFSFFPDGYYNHIAGTETILYTPWVMLLALILFAGWLGKKGITSAKLSVIGCAASLALVVIAMWQGALRYGRMHTNLLKMVVYYAQNDKWQWVLDVTSNNRNNYLYIGYRNLALSHLGRLGDDIFKYPQVGPLGLIPTWDESFNSSRLLSDIYYHIGDIAMAQEMAFEGINLAENGSPHLWKRLIDTNLIFDAPKVALKYINQLAKTSHYRGWAETRRELALHPERIAADPILGQKRKFFGGEQHLRYTLGIDYDLNIIIEHCPESHVAIEYLGCLYLLCKDLQNFGGLLDKYYGTVALPRLPLAFQEAAVMLYNEPGKLETLGVDKDVIARFAAFRKTLNSKSPNTNETLARYFGNTYWFYFSFYYFNTKKQ